MLNYDHLGQRPQGTLGHYMTYSGLLVLVICAAVARLLFDVTRRHVGGHRHAGARRRHRAHVHAQRVGGRASLAVALLFVLKDFRLLAILPVVGALFFAARAGAASPAASIRSSTCTTRPTAIASRCCARAGR